MSIRGKLAKQAGSSGSSGSTFSNGAYAEMSVLPREQREQTGAKPCAPPAPIPIYTPLYIAPSGAHLSEAYTPKEYARAGARGEQVSDRWETWHWIKAKTARIPGWLRRRCRRQALPLIRAWVMHGEPEILAALKALVEYWRTVPYKRLPPDLPPDPWEEREEWLDRCYEAGGYVTAPMPEWVEGAS